MGMKDSGLLFVLLYLKPPSDTGLAYLAVVNNHSAKNHDYDPKLKTPA